jgi:DNA polymerase elongation subunit (family B)
MSYISATRVEDRVIVWERNDAGERIALEKPAPYYFYYDDPNGEYRTIYDTPVSKCISDTNREHRAAIANYQKKGIKLWESDIPVEIRVLSNCYYGVAAPDLHTTFFDIEVDYDPDIGFSAPSNPYAPINAIAICHKWKDELIVVCVPPEDDQTWGEAKLRKAVEKASVDAPIPTKFKIKYVVCEDEAELLLHFLKEIKDSDVLCGWNSDFFDMPYTAMRIATTLDGERLNLSTTESINPQTGKIQLSWIENPNSEIQQKGRFKFLKQLDFPKYGMPSFRFIAAQTGKQMGVTVDLIGRIRVDYMNLVKRYEPGEKPSYKLAAISEDILVNDKTGESLLPKLEYEGSLADLYRSDFAFFIRYNIRDTEILDGFEDKLGYVDLANKMAHLSTGLFSHVNGTLKLAELALVNYCHHELKLVVNNNTPPPIDRAIDGALVLLPQTGMHELFGSIDINSLYPSGIRSVNISPETIRGQFLPGDDLWGCQGVAAKVVANSPDKFTLLLESGEELVKTGEEWRAWLLAKNWSISGYGTVFDQTKVGFIPAILTDWYNKRKAFQKLKAEASKAGDINKANYYDRLQYVYKIKLNSLYGALTNIHFRFNDLRMGESTTATGRVILRHQCRKVAETVEGNYYVDFPSYFNISDAVEALIKESDTLEVTLKKAQEVSLHGGEYAGRYYESKYRGKFQSDAVIYGDTDSTYFKTYADTPANAIKLADGIAKAVNESFESFMHETFLCNPANENVIKAGREIVSDRGIFVEKKRYILHLIDLDGKSVDKMKVMGLDTKKTTLPAAVSKELNKFIERFLKGESWESVSVSIVEYKQKLINSQDVTLLGLPKGVKGVEEYTEKYLEEGMGARLPGHVAASIYYNICLEEHMDKVSMPILTGMKIKVFYLLGKHGKFKSIALPTDLEVVPSWFLENFRIDKQAHIERLVDNPLTNILKAIGKPVPTKHSLVVDSLFEY